MKTFVQGHSSRCNCPSCSRRRARQYGRPSAGGIVTLSRSAATRRPTARPGLQEEEGVWGSVWDFLSGSEAQVDRNSRDFIKWVQRSLNQIMELNLAVDGISGRQTRSAIRSFQRRHGLKADGIVGEKTEAAIKAALITDAPAKPTSFRYVKGFSGPNADCVAALKRAGKTEAEALTIINTQIGVAIAMLRKAASDLKRGKRSSATRALFRQIFRVRPEFVPTWLKTTGSIKDRGDVVARRCKRVADLLASGKIKYFCTINSTNCPDCSNNPNKFACSSWGDESVAPGKSNVVCLGNLFWDDMRAGKTSSLLATLMHEPFHIYYGRYVTEHRSDAGKFGGINCIVQFVFETNGRTAPNRVNQRCKDTAVRNELGEIIGGATLEMETQGTAYGISGCISTFTVDGFGWARHRLTRSQEKRVADIARYIVAGSSTRPPLGLLQEIVIVGFASGTRRLEFHADERAKSVYIELLWQLDNLVPDLYSYTDISIGDPVTKPAESRAASDPAFRKVEICVR